MATVPLCRKELTHWGRVTHICVSKLYILGSDNGLPPGRRQAIISTNAGILLIWPLGTNFSEILIEINTFSLKKMHLKMSSVKWRLFVSASMCFNDHSVTPLVVPQKAEIVMVSNQVASGLWKLGDTGYWHAKPYYMLSVVLFAHCHAPPSWWMEVYSLHVQVDWTFTRYRSKLILDVPRNITKCRRPF